MHGIDLEEEEDGPDCNPQDRYTLEDDDEEGWNNDEYPGLGCSRNYNDEDPSTPVLYIVIPLYFICKKKNIHLRLCRTIDTRTSIVRAGMPVCLPYLNDYSVTFLANVRI